MRLPYYMDKGAKGKGMRRALEHGTRSGPVLPTPALLPVIL